MIAKRSVQIELTNEEALVLFEWLTHTEGRLPFVDPAEQTVLWRIEGQLESNLTEPLARDYASLLRTARASVNGEE